MNTVLRLYILLLSAVLVACAPVSDTGVDKKPESEIINATVCTDPRPEICTMEYMPVCAMHISGEMKTYSSGCSACSHQQVIHYQMGECETAK
ncbi:MAG: hypothetical protein V7459_06825 [Oceanicoccus sp.]